MVVEKERVIVRDGDELAAVTRNDADVAGGGYVGAIGVRPAWRGEGLGKAITNFKKSVAGGKEDDASKEDKSEKK